jgi:hypothetical protein
VALSCNPATGGPKKTRPDVIVDCPLPPPPAPELFRSAK